MKQEAISNFAHKLKDIHQEIDEYQPGETGFEHLPATERFDLIWRRVDALKEDQPHQNILCMQDGGGTLFTLIRSDSRTSEAQRCLQIEWEHGSQVVSRESVSYAVTYFCPNNPDTLRNLAIVEESLEVIEELRRVQDETGEYSLRIVSSDEAETVRRHNLTGAHDCEVPESFGSIQN